MPSAIFWNSRASMELCGRRGEVVWGGRERRRARERWARLRSARRLRGALAGQLRSSMARTLPSPSYELKRARRHVSPSLRPSSLLIVQIKNSFTLTVPF